MKKTVFFAVAFAALTFVGCNKEENNGKVVLNLGSEAYTSTEKLSLHDNYLSFNAGDQAIVNGETVAVSSANGHSARLWVTPADDYVVHYPANFVFFANNKVKTTFLGEVELVSANPNVTTTMVQGTHQTWPMSGYAENGNGTLTLLNNVAVLSPAVKYGVAWATGMWAQGGVDDMGWVANNVTLPVMTITSVVISSSDIKLTGTARLKNYEQEYDPQNDMFGTNGPEFVMEDQPNGLDSVVCHVNPAYQVIPTTAASGAQIMTSFGNLSIAPCQVAGKHLTITYYFNATVNGETHYYKYFREVTTGSTFSWKRGFRTTLLANFYDMNNPNDFSGHLIVKTTPFAF